MFENDFSFITAIILFILSFIMNFLWARFTLSVVSLNAISTATTSSMITFFSSVSVFCFVRNIFYIIPLTIGSWLGAYFLIWYHKKLKER